MNVTETVLHWHPAVQALLRVVFVVLPILILVPGLIWWERRLLSWMQDRIGPNRVGLFGLLQTICDGVKLFMKEDITPTAIDRAIYFFAPALALFPSFALAGTLPWGPNTAFTPIADVNIGILYILAVSSLGVYGIVLAGYASNNKYSLMGGLRSSAQLISYELAMGMSLAAVVLASGSLKITEIVKFQHGPLWGFANSPLENWLILSPFGLIAGLVFAICAIAETNRAPFDLPEAENELIAGYHTEYSSMKFAVFFMGEYAAMFVFSAIFVAIFMGGYSVFPISALHGISETLAPVWFIGKVAAVFSCFIWLRATLPRLRYDQLMSLGWRSLLPLAVTNFIVVAFWMLATEYFKDNQYAVAIGWAVYAVAMFVVWLLFSAIKRMSGERMDSLEERKIVLTSGREVVMTPGIGSQVPASEV